MSEFELDEANPSRPPDRTIREFAGLCLGLLGVIFLVSWYRHGHMPGPSGWATGALAVLIGVPGLIRPSTIRPIYILATALTRPIGHIVGVVLLAIVYFGLITPLAVAFRLAGRDGLGRYRSNADSYWIEHLPSRDVRLYVRQYQRQTAIERRPFAGRRVQTAATATVPSIPYHHSQMISGAKHGQQ